MKYQWNELPATTLRSGTAIAAEWDRLNAERGELPFLTAAAVACALDVFGSGGERLFIARAGEMIAAMLVLQREGKLRWATFQPSQIPLGSWVAARGVSATSLLDDLLQGPLRWSLAVSLTQIDPLVARREADKPASLHSDYIVTGWVDIGGDFSDYWSSRGKNLRQNMRKQRNRLAADGTPPRLRVLRSDHEMAQAIERYGRLESAGWKAAGGTAIHLDNAQGRFYRRLFEEAARDGSALVYECLFGDRTVAMNLCLLRGETLVVLKTTYDETMQQCSPAFLLHQDMLEALFAEGRIRRLEYYGRMMEWHTRWTSNQRTLYHLTVYRSPAIKRLALVRGRSQQHGAGAATSVCEAAGDRPGQGGGTEAHGAPSPSPARIGPTSRLKWQLFRMLERLSDLRGNSAAGQMQVQVPASPAAALWVFVSTIGELNAVDPFVRRLASRLAHLKLVLITDHAHYRDSYLARYPGAEVCVTLGHGDDARRLALHYPPRMLVVAEIPCLPSDAPCRFSFAFLLQAKARGASALLVNGWLYHYTPACRMDAIERALFRRDYLRAFDVICVQTEECRQRLVDVGALPERIAIAGNIKFDSMQRPEWRVSEARSPRLLQALLDSGRPIVVAGCVTNLSEQQVVLDAFAKLRCVCSQALLVLAPRHPEVAERMQSLREVLVSRGVSARFRSRIEDDALEPSVDCLVLDTIGDLRDFYAAATVAHVGVDHNVLEPLAFGKAVSVMPGWETTYPSYPVYRMLSAENALLEASNATQLAAHWQEAILRSERGDASATQAQMALQRARGAVERHFTAVQGCLEAAL